MFTYPLLGPTYGTVILLCMAIMVIEWLQRDKQHALQFSARGIFKYAMVRNVIYIVMIGVSYMLFMERIEDDSAFIYFQF